MANKTKDPFEPFKDWLKDGPAGRWPEYWVEDDTLTPTQKKIVSANAKLLQNRTAWEKHVDGFERALAKVDNEEARKERRGHYQIHFDTHEFDLSNFADRNFPALASFRKSKFLMGAYFDDVKFSGPADFNEVNFFAGATFSDTHFLEAADFTSSKFSQTADFSNVEFSGGVKFSKAKLSEMADFNNTRFSNLTVFNSSNFLGMANFINAEFSGRVFFFKTRFWEWAIFTNANFRSDVYFSDTEFSSGDMSAAGMEIDGSLFVKSVFLGSADFSRLEVKGTTSLSGSQFHQIPDFTDAKLDRPPDIAGMVVPQPETKKEKWWQFRTAVDSYDVVKLRKLKSMALDASDHEKDGEFFAKEMLAKRGWETVSFSGLLFNTIYWKLSDFGQSFVRPVLWMLASIYSFFCVYLGVINWQLGTYALPPSSDERLVAFSLSVFNFLPLLGGLFRFAKTPMMHDSEFTLAYGRLAKEGLDVDLMVWLNVFQNIIGAVLLFLFLLALRNKFRLK